MEVSNAFTDSIKQVLTIIGNGLFDERVLEFVAVKLNGSSYSFVLPSLPIDRKTGLAALESLLVLLDKGVKVKVSMFFIDKEHVKSSENIEDWLKAHGFHIVRSRVLGRRAIMYVLMRGNKQVRLYIALSGRRRSVEEDIATLYGLVYKRRIKADKARLKGKNLKELISKASYKDVEKSFSGLARIIKEVESGRAFKEL